MSFTRYGASHGEWDFWANDLKLLSDLLPVVCDPNVKISADSKLSSLGKTPSFINEAGEAMGIAKWTQKITVPKLLPIYQKEDRYGISLQTRRVYAIDIDVDDEELANDIEDSITFLSGALPKRIRGNSGRRVLLCRPMLGKTNAKKIIKLADGKGIVERLGNGQQVVVAGTHVSGARYEMDWNGHTDIPVLEDDLIEQIWQTIANSYGDQTIDYRDVEEAQPYFGNVDDPVAEYLFDKKGGSVLGSDKNKVYVECPWKDNHTCDSGPTQTAWLIAGSNNRETGMFKCMHAGCADKGRTEYLQAIGYVDEGFEILPALPATTSECDQAIADLFGEVLPSTVPPKNVKPLARHEKTGKPFNTYGNLTTALQYPEYVGLDVYYDNFSDLILVREDQPDAAEAMVAPPGWRPIRNTDKLAIAIALEQIGFDRPGLDMLGEVIRYAASTKNIDSFDEWAKGLEWDGIERVDNFLRDYAGAADTELNRHISRYLWTGMAARATTYGAKVDSAVIMCSAQGGGKSSLVHAMAPWQGAAGTLSFEKSDADNARTGRGKLVRELDELRGLKSKDNEAIKSWMTQTVDEFIPKYQEFTQRMPRRWVVIGTTNEATYLQDRTGNRRWLPVAVCVSEKEACLKGAQMLKAHHGYAREQLWAEAILKYQLEGVAYQELTESVDLEELRSNAMITDMADYFADLIHEWIESYKHNDELSVSEAVSYIGAKTRAPVGQPVITAIVKAIASLGYESKRVRREGRQITVWKKKQESKSESDPSSSSTT